MKTLIHKGMSGLVVITLGVVLTLFGISEGWAQQKRAISGKLPVETTKYTQQHAMDVGDVPGHQIRIFEIQRTYPTADAPTFEGVKTVEQWARGYSDYVDRNGHHWGYGIYFLENGDKVFSRFDGSSHTVMKADGSRKSTFVGVTTYTGGTGKFRGIRGTTRYSGIFDPKAGINKGQYEGQYWIIE